MAQRVLYFLSCTLIMLTPVYAQLPAYQPGLPAPGLQEIGDGWWRATSAAWVDHSDYVFNEHPQCAGGYESRTEQLFKALQAAAAAEYGVVIPLTPEMYAGTQRWIREQGGFIGQQLEPDRYANCYSLGVALPDGVVARSIRYYVGDGDRGQGECTVQSNPGAENDWLTCQPIGWAGWEHVPTANQIHRSFVAVFSNWSHDRARWAAVSVEFRMPGSGGGSPDAAAPKPHLPERF